jgi:HTH-type transcriptional regulator / antitoxin HipB
MRDYGIRTPGQLGDVLRGFRKQRQMSQADAGRKVGLAQNAVSMIETDAGKAGMGRVFKVLAALDLELMVRPRKSTRGKSEW